MIFQTLDDKKECVAVYCDGQLHQDQDMSSLALSRTWNYAAFLQDLDIEYANLYCLGESLSSACPDHLRREWEAVSERLRSYHRAFSIAKVDLKELCFYDLVQEESLVEFCEVKNRITQYVLENYEKPKNYDFLSDLSKVIHEIRYQELNLNIRNLDNMRALMKTRRFLKKLKEITPYVSYDIAGTRTGRLTTIKNSFPILTLDRDLRAVIEPRNDIFIELDFNAAELRTVLALSEGSQPAGDIHEWISKEVFKTNAPREEVKKKVFAWLYNPLAENERLESVFDRKKILDMYYDGKAASTVFGRQIEVDERRAFNYVVQSTTSDLLLKRMIKIFDILKSRRSFIAFSIHDSLVLDIAQEDKDLIQEIVDVFSETDLGKFKANVSMGKNFKKMQLVQL